jgi:hypothetical protein
VVFAVVVFVALATSTSTPRNQISVGPSVGEGVSVGGFDEGAVEGKVDCVGCMVGSIVGIADCVGCILGSVVEFVALVTSTSTSRNHISVGSSVGEEVVVTLISGNNVSVGPSVGEEVSEGSSVGEEVSVMSISVGGFDEGAVEGIADCVGCILGSVVEFVALVTSTST